MTVWSYPEPDPIPAHLRGVQLHEYSENVPREHVHGTGRCGALPARAFRPDYPRGCWRERGHTGPHSGFAKSAQRLDMAERRKHR